MKKTLLSLVMMGSIGIYTSNAQITLNSNHLINVGDVVEQANDTMPTVTIGSGGASQTWNFSALNQHTLDTSSFVAPGPQPGSSNFPLANMVMVQSGEDSVWTFINKSATGLYVVGQSMYVNSVLSTTNFAQTIVSFPSTMGTNYGGNWSGKIFQTPIGFDPDGPGPEPFIDSAKVTRASTITSNIDGWGNVTTPYGTFNSLRQLYIEENIDTTWTLSNGNWTIVSPTTAALIGVDPIEYDTNRTARWWTDDPSSKFPLVEMDYEANGSVNHVNWQKSAPTTSVEEAVIVNGDFVLFPNPAKSNITIQTKNASYSIVEILDVSGKLVATHKLLSNTINIDVSTYNNGIYFYNILDANGTKVYSNKFVVTK